MHPLALGSVIAETLAWAKARLNFLALVILLADIAPMTMVAAFVPADPSLKFDFKAFEAHMAVAVIFGAFTQAVVFARMTVDYFSAPEDRLSHSAIAGHVFLPLLGLAVVTSAATLLGLLAFIAPGVVIALMWALAAPALVAERLSIPAALSRSSQLTQGQRWRILGLALFLIAAALLSSLLWDLIFQLIHRGPAATPLPLWYHVGQEAFTGVIGVLGVVGLMVVYNRLRQLSGKSPGAELQAR
ncbi:MAG: hypothetical protein ACOY99_09875 [Pseudomonadota bacterium]|jgi:hypothetical protein